MEIRYTPTVEEFKEANHVALMNKGGFQKLKYELYVRRAFVVGPCLIVCGLFLTWQAIQLRVNPMVIILFFAITFGGGVGWLLNPWWYRRKVRRLFVERKGDTELIFLADDSGVSIARADGASDGRANWSIFEKAVETPNIFALFPNRGQCVYVARRAMTPEQQSEFRALVAAHVPGAARQPVAVS
jgi:hypothetical protein